MNVVISVLLPYSLYSALFYRHFIIYYIIYYKSFIIYYYTKLWFLFHKDPLYITVIKIHSCAALVHVTADTDEAATSYWLFHCPNTLYIEISEGLNNYRHLFYANKIWMQFDSLIHTVRFTIIYAVLVVHKASIIK